MRKLDDSTILAPGWRLSRSRSRRNLPRRGAPRRLGRCERKPRNPRRRPHRCQRFRHDRPANHESTSNDGDRVWVEQNIWPVYDDDGALLFLEGWLTDITKRKRHEAALRELNATLEKRVAARTADIAESSRFSRNVLDAIGSRLVVLDASGQIVSANAAWRRVGEAHGLTLAQYDVGVNYLEICDRATGPDAHAAHVAAAGIRDVIAGRRPNFTFEYLCQVAGGDRAFLCRVTRFTPGGPVRVVVTHDDVTEMHRARRQYADLFEFAPDGIIMVNPEGRITLSNQRAEQLFGWTREELADQPIEILLPAEKRVAHVPQRDVFINSPSRRRMAGERTGLTALRKDGAVFPIEIELASVETEQGTLIAAAVRDISLRIKLENQLAQATKMEAIGNLTGGMAHDFNNFLAVIIGNLDLLKEHGSVDPVAEKFIDTAIRGAERGADLCRSLLAFARRQPLRPTLTDPNERVRITIDLLQRSLGEDIEVATVLTDDPWPLRIDRGQFDSALVNLYQNARDAMANGGRLTITTRRLSLAADDPKLAADTVPGDYMLLEVADTGVGIPADLVPRIFDPFFTTKDVGHGTGIGLSMVHGFVNQSGGFVEIESEVGKGATMRLYLPRAEDAEDVEPKAVCLAHGGGETVLVVDDTPDVLRTSAAVLRSLGYTVMEAVDGEAALSLLGQLEQTCDLLLTDVKMPGGIDGVTLAKRSRTLRPDLKVLLTSGFSDDAFRNGGDSLEDMLLLSKPYRKEDLARAVRTVLDDYPSSPRRAVSDEPQKASE